MCRIMRILFCLCPILAFSAPETMLSQAEEISQIYSQQVAKSAPPSPFPMAENALQVSSVWISLSLNDVFVKKNESALSLFNKDDVWQTFREIGIDGVRMEALRKEGQIGIDPKWGNLWPQIIQLSRNQNISLIGDSLGNATIAGADFQKALQNESDYLNLYNLVEIDPQDWKLLPTIPKGSSQTNVPWLTIQELHKLGYVPRDFTPYTKESAWNATDKVLGIDGKTRRWIYLKEGENNPVLSWLSQSFTAYRLATSDALNSTRELGERILHLDGKTPWIAQETLALWIRKIGAYSAVQTDGTLLSMKSASADLVYEVATRPALLHALITQDARALRMMYQLFLDSGIDAKRMVHSLQPFDQYACDWVELMHAPKKKFQYAQEQITGEILKARLLKEDLLQLGENTPLKPSTWVDHCARAIGVKDFKSHEEEITNAHLLLAFTYAMQPGAFSISAADLLGALPNGAENLNLFETNPKNLYASLPCQLQNPRSFASKLKMILQARRDSNIATGELILVPQTQNPGTLLLLHRLPNSRFLHLLAINFGRKAVTESVEQPDMSQTSAIDILSGLAAEKVFSSASFSFTLPPLSGRAFYFQPKYYD